MDAHTQEVYSELRRIIREDAKGLAIGQVLEEQLVDALGSIIKAHGYCDNLQALNELKRLTGEIFRQMEESINECGDPYDHQELNA